MDQAQQRSSGGGEPFHIMARKRMIDLGLKQHQLAERSGLSKNTLSAILNGRSPRWEHALAIVTALELQMAFVSETRQ